MKKEITTLALILNLGIAKTQSVGIGTSTPDASTKLHIEDTLRGILIPKVSILNVNIFGLTANTQTEGILIYNINSSTIGGIGKGFYYWDAIKWYPLRASTNDDQTLIYTTDGF